MITATILADSVGPTYSRITTFLLYYPRFIHSELMTHRVFSRNVASSRARPITKVIEGVDNDPALPEYWGANQPGMQAESVLPSAAAAEALRVWLAARDNAVNSARQLMQLGCHKQICNRLLEPWVTVATLVTATEWQNFFALRANELAQPESQVLAYRMLDAYLRSTPAMKDHGEWHVPFGDRMPDNLTFEQQIKIATARCARVSYMTFNGAINPDEDYKLHDDLAAAGHWSPFEHCAQAIPHPTWSGNFREWRQYRKTFTTENRTADLSALLAAKPEWVTL